MSSQTAVHIRFPSGFSEITYAEDMPKVGDRLKRGEQEWEVVAVEPSPDGCERVTLAPPQPNNGKVTAKDA